MPRFDTIPIGTKLIYKGPDSWPSYIVVPGGIKVIKAGAHYTLGQFCLENPESSMFNDTEKWEFVPPKESLFDTLYERLM